MAKGRWAFCAVILACARLFSAHDAAAQAVAPAVVEAPPAADVTIYLIMSPWHSDIVIPRAAFEHAPEPVKTAADQAGAGDWIIVGWGPIWFGRDLQGGPFHPAPIRTVSALWTLLVPQIESRVRVAALAEPGPAPGEGPSPARPIRVTAAGLEHLIERVNAAFAVGPDGGPIRGTTAGAAKGVSLYRSHEIYHLLHECNQWAGEVLRAGGIHTQPLLLDGLPPTLTYDLKRNDAFAPSDAAAVRLTDRQAAGAPLRP